MKKQFSGPQFVPKLRQADVSRMVIRGCYGSHCGFLEKEILTNLFILTDIRQTDNINLTGESLYSSELFPFRL